MYPVTQTNPLELTGKMIIGSSLVRGTGEAVYGVDPRTGDRLEPGYAGANADDVDRACQLAEQAFDGYRNAPVGVRADFLDSVAAGIEALGDTLVQRAVAESGLPEARLTGELARTTGQLRLFGQVLREGSWQGARIDPGSSARPDIRQRQIPLGPVAVFGASNFPLAFSVAGGDTASALAAGCPVVVKAHEAHPGTSELVGRVVAEAVRVAGLPEGVFSMLYGDGPGVGTRLVTDPRIQAVGFTGSRGAGLAIVAAAAARPRPIPVYAEMSSVNPVFVLPGALATRGAELGAAYAASLTLGAGQFCTNPGLVFAPRGPELDTFLDAAAKAVEGDASPSPTGTARPGSPGTLRSPCWPGASGPRRLPADRPYWPPSRPTTSPATSPSSRRSSAPRHSWFAPRPPTTSSSWRAHWRASSPPPCTPTAATTRWPRDCCRYWSGSPGGCCSTAGPPA
jgi:NADP-dependent aldehyde dehydrogenase